MLPCFLRYKTDPDGFCYTGSLLRKQPSSKMHRYLPQNRVGAGVSSLLEYMHDHESATSQ